MPHLSVSTNNITSTIKGICIDENVVYVKSIFVDYNKIDEEIYICSNPPGMNVKSVLMDNMTNSGRSEDLKPSVQEVLGDSGKTLERNVGEEKILSPISTFLHETSKPVMNDLRSSIDNGYIGATIVDDISSENIIERSTYFPQEFDTDSVQVDLSSQRDGVNENQNLRSQFDQVIKQDGKLTMASSMQVKESSQMKEAVNLDLFEENKLSFSATSTDIESNKLENIEGVSSDVKWETRDISAVNEMNNVNNQQIVKKPIVVTVQEPIIDGITSAPSSFTQPIHDESSFSGVNFLPSSISTSGRIPYSGNISHRSDSSTTSAQSFAFPVLQSEWNSSPVKMAKADRRHLRRRRWRTILICCRF